MKTTARGVQPTQPRRRASSHALQTTSAHASTRDASWNHHACGVNILSELSALWVAEVRAQLVEGPNLVEIRALSTRSRMLHLLPSNALPCSRCSRHMHIRARSPPAVKESLVQMCLHRCVEERGEHKNGAQSRCWSPQGLCTRSLPIIAIRSGAC